jgi:hypothetical protein
VFTLLLDKGKLTTEMIAMLSRWRHSGFHVYCGSRISPDDESALEKLARYIVRASFSQERMRYLEHEGKVVYTAENGKDAKVFAVLAWLAATCCHIPRSGRADGTVLWVLQQCFTGKTESGGDG